MSGTVHSALVRLVLSGAQRYGADATVLAREACLPGWALASGELRFPAAQLARLWQVSAARLGDPRIGLHVAAGRRVAPARVEFAGPAPRSHGELAEAFGTERIAFGAEVGAMTFSRADLDLPLRRADPALARLLRRIADAQLAVPERIPRWLERFREVLGRCLDDQDIQLGAAALRLHVSPRTLQRLLEREGTTWRAEVDRARRERAARLRRAGTSPSQTAYRLGYADARSLRRAARRWQRP